MTIAGARCVVLGAGGFIGLNLCRALLAAGAEVRAVGRAAPAGFAPAGLEWTVAEFADRAAIAAAVAGADRVFHLLGGSVPAQSNADPVGDVVGSLLPSIQLLDACRAGGVGRLVFASSGGTVYGPNDGGLLGEEAPTNPITAYGANKLAVEKYVGLYRHQYGLDGVVLRIANPYGPFQHQRRPQGLVGATIARALAADVLEIWGDGSVVRDYLHIDDLTAAMLAAADYAGEERVFNVGSGIGRSVREVVADVCALTGRAWEDVRFNPGRAEDVPVNVLDIARLTRATGWAPRVDWHEGLRDTARWLAGQRAA